jgi:hypothetical protein
LRKYAAHLHGFDAELLRTEKFKFRLFRKNGIGLDKDSLITNLVFSLADNDLPTFDDSLLNAVFAFDGMQCINLLDACKLSHMEKISFRDLYLRLYWEHF